MRNRPYIERALFIAGSQNTGKSRQIRSMFIDERLGLDGAIPERTKIRESYCLSRDRRLYVRITSPHEWGESLTEFFAKIEAKTDERRWSVVSPLQIEPDCRAGLHPSC